MSRRACAAGVLCLLTSVSAWAQHWEFQNYGTDSGLTNPTILAIHQDRKGFLWVSTEGGLFRYDGDRFQQFEVRLPHKAGLVASLHSSGDGRLWAGSLSGLFRWTGDQFAPVPGFEAVELQSNQAIASDATHVYVASASGVWSAPLSGVGVAAHLSSMNAESIFVSRDKTVWCGCGAGLWSLREGRFSEIKDAPTGPWTSIQEDSEGHLWVRSFDRVFVRENGSFHEVGHFQSAFKALLTPAKSGEMLVPHSGGMSFCNLSGCRNYGVESGLQNAEILTAHFDREGSVWIGYGGRGLSRWLGREQWQSFSEPEGLSDSKIWRIARDRWGDLWVGTNRGLFHGVQKRGRWTFTRSEVLREWTVYGLLADLDGSLWLGTFQYGLGGLVHFDPRTGHTKVYSTGRPMPHFSVNNLSLDSTGVIWVATAKGVLRLVPGGKQLEDFSFTGTGASTRQVLHIGGATYITGRKGLYIERDGISRLVTVRDGLKDNSIQSISQSPAGDLWLAYYAPLGLTRLKWDRGRIALKHFGVAEGLPSNVVYSQFFDQRGRHWIGTDNGVAAEDGGRWLQYDTRDGMISNDCNAASYLVEKDGAVWIGTSAGMSRFFPAHTPAAPVPSALITGIVRNDALVTGDLFDADTRSLALRFTVLSYRRPNPVFRYRLGRNSNWIQTQEHEVHFAELPPGSYEFEVQGESAPGMWSYPATRKFTLQPPWYQSARFEFGGLAAVTGLIWFGWRQRESQQRKIRADLELAVAERTRSLAAATARAEQESRFKGEFLANMSHEMRTPLNGVLGLTRMAMEISDQPEVVRHLSTVQFSAKVLLSLINDVLDLAKIEAGMLNIVPVTFAPHVLLHELRMMFDTEAGNKGLQFELSLEQNVPSWLWGDDSRLRQVLVNLIGNALKFTHHGRITVSFWHDGTMLHASVSDTGIGINPAHQSIIFEVFRQADNSTSRRYGGSGLGLAISRKLVESMGGCIGVNSEPGQGSTFWFEIPAPPKTAPETKPVEERGSQAVHGSIDVGNTECPRRALPAFTEEEPAIAGSAPPPVRSMRILIAEDNQVNQYLLCALLRKRGHYPVVANNGREALAICDREQFDLILMDIQMPEMDGLEAVRLIRQREAAVGGRVPIVAVTARAMPEDRAEILAAGMDDYLEKPIQNEHLDAILDRIASSVVVLATK